MSHHFVKQFIHVMWSTHQQQYIILPEIRNQLYAYLTTLIKSKSGVVLAIGGFSEHIHLLISLPPMLSLSSLLSHIKACSSKWLKSFESIRSDFSWQEGYFAASVDEARLEIVSRYIHSDELRHQTKGYCDELIGFLNQQGIKYDEKYYLQSSHAKIYIHAIWSTSNRRPLLHKEFRENFYNNMRNIISNLRGSVHSIGGVEDHVHVFFEIPKDKALSDLVRDVKVSSTHWLKGIRHDGKVVFPDFEWQTGFGAFTVSLSSLDVVKKYIQNQEEHHRRHTFQEEWNKMFFGLDRPRVCPVGAIPGD